MSLLVMACTENERAKRFGDTLVIDVPAGHKVIEATWKDNQLWYLTEEMDSSYVPKAKTFKEKSDFGVLEGTIVFKESK